MAEGGERWIENQAGNEVGIQESFLEEVSMSRNKELVLWEHDLLSLVRS